MILFLGTPTHDFKESVTKPDGAIVQLQKDITKINFEKTLAAAMDMASKHPEQPFTLVYRPHPREGKKEMYPEAVSLQINIPPNLLVVSGAHTKCTMDETAYVSDIITGLYSTEHFKGAFQRQIPSFFEFFKDEPGLGGDAIYLFINEQAINEISQCAPDMPSAVYSEEELKNRLEQVYANRDRYKDKPEECPKEIGGSASRIADILFAKNDRP